MFHTRGFSQTKPEWKLVERTADSISIYKSQSDDGALYMYAASCLIPKSPKSVFESASATETYKDLYSRYVANYKETVITPQKQWYLYQHLSFPLVADRDYTLKYETSYDSKTQTYVIHWTAANDKGPGPITDVIRVTKCNGTILIHPDAKSHQTFVQYTIYTDPGGWLPGWLINLVNKSTLPDMMRVIETHCK